MTEKQLEKMGIHRDGGRMYPNRYFCIATNSYLTIYKNDTQEDIMKSIYEKGIERGTEEGKMKRSEEFKSLLNIGEEF